jgi:hypothetical protein
MALAATRARRRQIAPTAAQPRGDLGASPTADPNSGLRRAQAVRCSSDRGHDPPEREAPRSPTSRRRFG